MTLGALLADVPHTRPAPVTGERDERGARRGARPRSPPATRARPGSSASLHDACRARGHHVGQPVGRGAALRLAGAEPARRAVALRPARRPARLADRHRRAGGGERDLHQQVSEAVAADAETAAYVEELEQRAESSASEIDAPVGRLDRRGADALPARARAGRRRARARPASSSAPRVLAERER